MTDSLLRCFDFSGKTACVTGAASGIGRAAATLLADLGAVVHAADRDEKGLDTLAATRPGTFKPIIYDQADRGSVEHLASTIGPVDVLINNAGILLYEPLIDLKWDDLERVVATRPGRCDRSHAAGRRRDGRAPQGTIVHTGSQLTFNGAEFSGRLCSRQGRHLAVREDGCTRMGPARYSRELRRARADLDGDQ
jgi:NAD(P)-dependent dehydrogenase (short-subunit alcohol dehydrogenase family)